MVSERDLQNNASRLGYPGDTTRGRASPGEENGFGLHWELLLLQYSREVFFFDFGFEMMKDFIRLDERGSFFIPKST